MKKMLIAAAFSSALAGLAGTALAADVMAPVYDWSGAYLGLQAGYGWGDTEHFNPPGRTGTLDIDGFAGGLEGGFNFQSDALVLGLEADISLSNIEGSHGPALFNPGPNSFNCGSGPCITEVNWLSTARLRAGYAMDNFLPYVTGGVAVGGVDATIPNDPTLTAGDSTQVGWTVGAGLEYGFNNNISAKFEYLYVDLGEWRYDNNNSNFSADANFSLIRAGVNWHF
jgi:outer membrane immunogenic protein